jgi:hypothetical protein
MARGNTRHGHLIQSTWTSSNTANHQSSLKDLLEEGQTGRVQHAGRELLAWLNADAPPTERVSFRMSDAARMDLKQFQVGLSDLSATSSRRAVESLRSTLATINKNLPTTGSVSQTSQLFVVACEDANIYFRKLPGQIELVRILPIDLSKAERQ